MARQINAAGLKLIGDSEGERLVTYLDPVRKLTVGVGHLVLPTDRLVLGDRITKARSEKFLAADLAKFEHGVEQLTKVSLSGNEFAALVSLAFNIGLGALGKSTLLRKLNAGDRQGASEQFSRWTKAGRPLRVLPGLVKRRLAERNLFLNQKED